MARLFVGNFSFEQTRALRDNPSRQLLRCEAELACVWLAVAAPGDEILCPAPMDARFWNEMASRGMPIVRALAPGELKASQASEIVPWGWTEQVRRLAKRLRIVPQAPDQERVWEANSRVMAGEIAATLGCPISGEGLARSPGEFETLLRRAAEWPQGWIIKANYGQAGRGQLRGRGAALTTQQAARVANMLKRQNAVNVEPFLVRRAEYGVQWDVPREGPPALLGVTQLLTDERGQYLGSRILADEDLPSGIEAVIDVHRQAARQLQTAGYFGPLGIDAMLYESPQGLRWRALQDVNARWTMGRLALEWGGRFAGEPGGVLRGSEGREIGHLSLVNCHLSLNTNSENRMSAAGERGEGSSERSGFGGRDGRGVAIRPGVWLHQSNPPGPHALPLSPETVSGQLVRQRTWWVE
jgi:hypothetical protein